MGGPVAISDAVVSQVSAATGLPAVDPTPTPAAGVVRAAGADRFETATIVADLLGAYAPAYLPVDLQAVDADLLDAGPRRSSPRTPCRRTTSPSPMRSWSPSRRRPRGDFTSPITQSSTSTAAAPSSHGWPSMALKIRDSATRLPPDDSIKTHQTLTGVTSDAVPAGQHTVTLQAGSVGCTLPNTGVFNYATGTVLGLGD